MSTASIFLFVGSTTLAAALVTLFALQITAAKFERRVNRRSRTLEGPVPGRRCLSSIGINTESDRMAPRPTRPPARELPTQMAPAVDTMQQLELSALPLPLTPLLDDDAKLNSLQTIRARSASLHNDIQPDQSAGPGALPLDDTASAQRLPNKPVSDPEQEQGPATPRTKSKKNASEADDTGAQSFAPAAPAAEPTLAPRTSPSKRARRNNSQPERAKPPQRRSEQAPRDATDPLSLDLLDSLRPGDLGGSLGRDGELPDIFAGLNEADTGIQGLADDLTDIDGGGLPAPARKAPQKSRR